MTMHSYTVNDIMALRPCAEYSEAFVTALWDGREALTASEIAELDIPPEDRIWALSELATPRAARLFACRCAERALRRVVDNGGTTDPRSWYALVIARLYADGHRTGRDLHAAQSAAQSAAICADSYSAARAAERATWAAADLAARAAADLAAEAAAKAVGSAAEYTEQKLQPRHLAELMEAERDDGGRRCLVTQ